MSYQLRLNRARNAWRAMRTRCTNRNQECSKYYIDRGITYCSEWGEFDRFLADMGLPPTPGHTIERIDVDGNYCPENCRWATMKEQANNKRNNRPIEIDGVVKNLAEWCADSGLSVVTVHRRLGRGWLPREAIFTPATRHNNRNYKPVEFRGELLTLRAIAQRFGIHYDTLRQRIRLGRTLEQAVTDPVTHARRQSPTNIDTRTGVAARWNG